MVHIIAIIMVLPLPRKWTNLLPQFTKFDPLKKFNFGTLMIIFRFLLCTPIQLSISPDRHR